NGMVKEQLREPYETARKLFREKIEKIVIKRGAKPEDITALFFQLDEARLSLHDFSSKIEVVYRPQAPEQILPAVAQAAPAPQPSVPQPNVEKLIPAAAQPAKPSVPEVKPAPVAPKPKTLTPTELFLAGKRLYREGLAFESWQAIHKEAEEWTALAKTEIERYKDQIGPNGRGWTQDLLAGRDTFCKLAETISKFQREIGLPVEEIEIPHYQGGSVEHLPKTANHAPHAQAKPDRHAPDAFPRPREGFLDGLRITVEGFIGNYVRFGGEKRKEFVPIHLSHSDRLEWSPVIDTGIVLNHQHRALKIHCTKDFLESTAPLLLKAIADGQNFIFDMHYYLSPEEELVCAQQHIGSYTPRGVMPSGTFKSLREQYNDAFGHFPFRLTIEGFSQKWTVRDLIEAMAKRHLQAVGIEKEPETAVNQSAKPPRPLSCDRLYYLRETCAKIFEIWHSPDPNLGEFNGPERKTRITSLAGEDIRPWLKHLDSGGVAALTAAYPDEYQERLRITRNPDYYPNLIKATLYILDRVYKKT
ncbi:MAG: hypothetical protein PHG97_01945, partial [Candidatus Margulisbacteria bacterium]|nr:hypothetical protein [Candidatus Margulisiibacteriota bacterium]